MMKTEEASGERRNNNVEARARSNVSDAKDIIKGLIKIDSSDHQLVTPIGSSSFSPKNRSLQERTTTEDEVARQPVSVEIKQDGSANLKNTVPIKKVIYTSKFTCFEWTLIILNLFIFAGIILTLIALLRVLAFAHQKDIVIFLSQLLPPQ